MKYLFNLALVFIAISAAAQSNYQSGYIVKNNNDTLRGFINSQDRQVTQTYIEFKKSKDDISATKYTPADIKSCYVAPYYTYISYTGKLSNNKNFYPNVDEVKDTTTIYGSFFLQKITGGPNAALYVNTDERKIRYFLKEKNSSAVELIYYEYGISGEQTTKESPYLGKLIEAFVKYNGVNNNRISDLQRTTFTLASLEDAIAVINKGVKDKTASPHYSRFFMGASVASIKSTISNLIKTVSSPATTTNISPQISLGVDFINNPDVQKLLFRVELSFSYTKPNYTFSYTPNGINTIDNNTYDISRYTVSVIPQFLYNIYSTIGFKFFVGAGMAINYSVIPNNTFEYYQIVSFSPYTLKGETRDGINSQIAANFPLETGIVLNKHIELTVSYSPPITLSSAGGNYKSQSFGGGINYLF